MDPVSIALALAQFAPSLLRYFGVGEKSTGVVEKAIAVATSITGAKSPEEALEMLKANVAAQQEYNMAILKAEADIEAAYISDLASARNRDIELAKNGSHNYRADSMYVMAAIATGFLVWVVLRSELDEYAKGIITLVIGRFLGYLDGIYNFEFGSTRTSRTKDKTIATLSDR